jgi:PAS domain S-box-containing protein
MRYTGDDGQELWARVASVPIGDTEGPVTGAAVAVTDIDALKRGAEALRAIEARYRTLVENVRDYAIFRLDAEGVVTDWTAGAESVKGYTSEEVVGRHVALFYTPEAVAVGDPARELAEAASTGRAEREDWRVRKGGARFWANEIATAIRDTEGRLVGFTKISRDLTDRRLAEAAAEQVQLAVARDDLRRRLAAAEEAERRRLARELHDQLGQQLTAFRLGLDEAARLAATHEGERAAADAPLLRRLAQLQALTGRMTAGARYLALELRPPELDDLGLESALTSFVAEWSVRYGVTADVAVTGGDGRAIPAEIDSTLYRIVQEALTNVAKHADATQVSVIVEKPDGEVRLIVEDDGRGFDPEGDATRVRSERRLGLAGMRERAALVGGTVAVESSPGGGTALYVRLPVDRAPAGAPAGGPAGAARDGVRRRDAGGAP